MTAPARCSPAWKRRFHATASCCRPGPLRPLESASRPARGPPDIQAFKEAALAPGRPFLFRAGAGSPTAKLPAAHQWFSHDAAWRALTPRVAAYESHPFPYELVQPCSSKRQAVLGFRDWLMQSSSMIDRIMAGILQSTLAEGQGHQFSQLDGPLGLLTKALEFNQVQHSKGLSTLELYIAQCSLTDLPPPLQEDLPTPELVLRAGKGDVYNSSIWLGTEPTYTPLHRDPNPNLFCQLCGTKTIRLLPPASGDRLYFEVQVKIRRHGNSRIRTTEMMEGEERTVLHNAVWANTEPLDDLHEADLGPGDALFIPDGWWHSVRSIGEAGQLNGSVNWWFR